MVSTAILKDFVYMCVRVCVCERERLGATSTFDSLVDSTMHFIASFLSHSTGEFDDDGPGWDRYPQIKKLLNPVIADDGIFWVTKNEFFQYYQTIYLSASDMTEFLED